MPERAPSVRIGQLSLRVPAASAGEGHALGEAVAQSLANNVPSGLHRDIGSLSVRVHQPADASPEAMTAAITNAVTTALGRTRHG